MLIGNTVRQVPHTGVIYVMQEAAKLGYTRDSLEWSNLGQIGRGHVKVTEI